MMLSMRVRQEYEHTLSELTDRLEAIRTTTPGGPPQFRSAEFNLIISVLESAIDFNPTIPEADRRGLLRSAVSEAAKGARIEPGVLQKHLISAEGEYLRKPLYAFVLATAFGIERYHGAQSARINDVRVSLGTSLPRRFDRSAIKDRIEELAPSLPANIAHVLARVSARTPNAAFDRAYSTVELIRAMWNFMLNYGRYQLFSIGPSKPVNRILPGNVHTLHRTDGTCIEDIFWLDSQPLKSSWIYTPDEQWLKVQKRSFRLLSRLRSINYRSDLENALVRYTRALDCADARSSFNRVWSVLEYLTDSIGNYKKLISRACFLVPHNERRFVRVILQHLRDVRNGLVHADEERSNIETYLYQLKLITDRLIMFHLRNGNRFASRAGSAEYLDTPTDRTVLTQRIREYRRALRQVW
jgi:hypothetical protein